MYSRGKNVFGKGICHDMLPTIKSKSIHKSEIKNNNYVYNFIKRIPKNMKYFKSKYFPSFHLFLNILVGGFVTPI